MRVGRPAASTACIVHCFMLRVSAFQRTLVRLLRPKIACTTSRAVSVLPSPACCWAQVGCPSDLGLALQERASATRWRSAGALVRPQTAEIPCLRAAGRPRSPSRSPCDDPEAPPCPCDVPNLAPSGCDASCSSHLASQNGRLAVGCAGRGARSGPRRAPVRPFYR